MQLAIDTSTDMASIALIEENSILAELTWRCEQNHSVELLPRLDNLLKEAGVNTISILANNLESVLPYYYEYQYYGYNKYNS